MERAHRGRDGTELHRTRVATEKRGEILGEKEGLWEGGREVS